MSDTVSAKEYAEVIRAERAETARAIEQRDAETRAHAQTVATKDEQIQQLLNALHEAQQTIEALKKKLGKRKD